MSSSCSMNTSSSASSTTIYNLSREQLIEEIKRKQGQLRLIILTQAQQTNGEWLTSKLENIAAEIASSDSEVKTTAINKVCFEALAIQKQQRLAASSTEMSSSSSAASSSASSKETVKK